jgi:hypothetical protein
MWFSPEKKSLPQPFLDMGETRGSHVVHPVVPVPGADERQAALAEFEAVQNGAHAVVV